MRTMPLASVAAMWDGLPPVARLLVLALAAAVVAILALPLIHRMLFVRRVRQLPPPVVKVDTGPALRLPRRNPEEPPET